MARIEFQTMKASLIKPTGTLPYIIKEQNKEMYERNMSHLSVITETIVLCGKQNIPLRGHRDDSTSSASNKGSFLAILEYLANHNALLSKHLQYSKKNATYTSKSTQN